MERGDGVGGAPEGEVDGLRDPVLLAAFRGGEHRVLAVVYGRYARGLGAYLTSLARARGALDLAQPSAVADLLQEVFSRAFSDGARRAYDAHRPYGPYLKAIAKNCFFDLIRKRRREPACELHDPTSLDRAFLPGCDDDTADRNVLAVVEAYVSGLSAPLREIYEQRFAAGLTQKAVCGALGITRRALRTAEAQLKRGVCEALFAAGALAPSAPGPRSPRRAGEGRRAKRS